MGSKYKPEYDFWLADGSPDFGHVNFGIKGISPGPAPIRLQRGNQVFGAEHIQIKHGNWVRRQKLTIPELVWKKCHGSGTIYTSDGHGKSTVFLPIAPSALLVIRYRGEATGFWTVTTLYAKSTRPDGHVIGRYNYPPDPKANPPTFTIADTQQPLRPNITVKRRRRPRR